MKTIESPKFSKLKKHLAPLVLVAASLGCRVTSGAARAEIAVSSTSTQVILWTEVYDAHRNGGGMSVYLHKSGCASVEYFTNEGDRVDGPSACLIPDWIRNPPKPQSTP